MGWNKNLPATDQELRTLGGVLTDNFQAVEEGDETSGTPIFQRAILLGNRSSVATAADPVVVGATTYMYSKLDGGGVQEAFVRAPAAAIVQISQGGRMGSDVTDIGFESFSHNEGTTSYNEDNLVTAWAAVASAGGLDDNKGFATATRDSLGKYTLTFDAALDDANYAVLLTVSDSGSSNKNIKYTSKAAGSFKVEIRGPSTGLADKPFSAMVLGGR